MFHFPDRLQLHHLLFSISLYMPWVHFSLNTAFQLCMYRGVCSELSDVNDFQCRQSFRYWKNTNQSPSASLHHSFSVVTVFTGCIWHWFMILTRCWDCSLWITIYFLLFIHFRIKTQHSITRVFLKHQFFLLCVVILLTVGFIGFGVGANRYILHCQVLV